MTVKTPTSQALCLTVDPGNNHHLRKAMHSRSAHRERITSSGSPHEGSTRTQMARVPVLLCIR